MYVIAMTMIIMMTMMMVAMTMIMMMMMMVMIRLHPGGEWNSQGDRIIRRFLGVAIDGMKDVTSKEIVSIW